MSDSTPARTGLDLAVDDAVAALTPSTASLRNLTAAFRRAMSRALAGEPSPIGMLPTFAVQPDGHERGRVAVVDWGGTNGRALLVQLEAGRAEILSEHAFAFADGDKQGPAERAFDAVAGAVARVAGGRHTPRLPLGFVYSFPARLEAIDRAYAVALTKGWRLSGLVGRDVAALLQAALARHGLADVRVAAVANDTVSTLVWGTYRARGREAGARAADVGLIVGTGTNHAADLGPAGIRNLECGNFDEVEEVATRWDRELDREVADPPAGAQRFEKLVAGPYLGEIVRRAARGLGPAIALRSAEALDRPWCLDGSHIATFASDASPGRSAVEDVLRTLGAPSAPAEREAWCRLACAVGVRSARLTAAALAGTLTFIDPGLDSERTVAVDGSVYGGYPGYPEMVREALEELIGIERAARVRLMYARDSTAAGGAVIAAVAARQA